MLIHVSFTVKNPDALSDTILPMLAEGLATGHLGAATISMQEDLPDEPVQSAQRQILARIEAPTQARVVQLGPVDPKGDPWNDPRLAESLGKGRAALTHLILGWRQGFGKPDAPQPDRTRLLAEVQANLPDIFVYVQSMRPSPKTQGGLITATVTILATEDGAGGGLKPEQDKALRREAVDIASNLTTIAGFSGIKFSPYLEPWDTDKIARFIETGNPDAPPFVTR